jgi:hypothetical protein
MARQPENRDWQRHVIEQMLPRMEANTGPAATRFEPGPITEAAAPTPLAGAPHTSPAFDPIERLPDEERKDLLRKIRQHADDARALAVPFEDVRAASMDRIEKENAHRRLTSHAQDGGFNLPETDSRVIAAQQALTKAIEDQRRLQERSKRRAAALQAALQAQSACEDCLRHVPANCKLEAVEIEPPKLNKGEAGLLDAIENRRHRVREIKASIHAIESAPYPSSYAKKLLREAIETLAQRGTPDVSTLIEHWRSRQHNLADTARAGRGPRRGAVAGFPRSGRCRRAVLIFSEADRDFHLGWACRRRAG